MIYRGRVTGGQLSFDPGGADRWLRAIGDLEGHAVELTIRRARSKRSLDQNAYLHAVPLPMLAEEFGYDKDEIPQLKLALLGECFGVMECGLERKKPAFAEQWSTPVELPKKPSTADLTTKEFADFIDWLIRWAAREHNVIIPLPNEVDLSVYDEQ